MTELEFSEALLDRLLFRATWAGDGNDIRHCWIAADAIIADLAVEGHITAEQAQEKARAWAHVCEQEALRRMARASFEATERPATVQ